MAYTFRESLGLSKKKFFRAPQWELKLAVRILIGFLALYFLVAFLFLGIGLFFILRKEFPEQDPVSIINQWIIFYFGADILARYFLQNPPVTDVKTLLIQPIPKKRIIRGVLLRSLSSIFNWFSVLLLLPFCIVVSIENGATFSIWSWFFAMLLITGTNNFLVFLINKNKNVAIGVLLFLAGGYVLENYMNVPVISSIGIGFEALYIEPLWTTVILVFFLVVLQLTATFLKKELYLDKGLSKKKEKIIGSNLYFLDRWGPLGILLKNDIRLIIRNIRARQVVLTTGLFLFYGLFFFTQELYLERPAILVFAGIFITGGFTITFGQFIPAWDSEYYSMLMSQNLTYKRYLKSKLYLLMFSVVISMVFAMPYVYFGKKVVVLIIGCGIFNFGLGALISLFSGAYNATPLKLNVKAKAFENTKGFNLMQFIFSIPKLVLPVLVFYIPYFFLGFNAGIVGLITSGLGGFFLRNQILGWIEKIYQIKKYETLAAFNKQQS